MSEIQKQVTEILNELIAAGGLKKGDIIALGCSSSEVIGNQIGKAGSVEVGKELVAAVYEALKIHGIFLAVQGCEHINRALVVEKTCANAYNLEQVGVRPTAAAGGSCAAAAFEILEDAVVVEHIQAHAGVDIGDTHIGMQVKFVQVPFRPTHKKVGQAHVTALTSRPKLIGGARAQYS